MTCGPGIYSWEASLGCVSHYSVDLAAWPLSAAPYVSSMYHRRVMIVEAQVRCPNLSRNVPAPKFIQTTTSSSSLTLEPTTNRITKTPSETAVSTTSDKNIPTAKTSSIPDPGLSKGAIAGIAIGAIVGFVVIATLAYLVWFVRRRQTGQAPAMVHADPPEFVNNKVR